MPLSNEEIIAKVKEKLDRKNKLIKERDEEIDRLKKKIEQLEGELEGSFKKIENRDKLLDTINDILTEDGE